MELTEKDVIDSINRGIDVLTDALKEEEGEEIHLWAQEQIDESRAAIRKIKRNSHYPKHIAELVQSKYIEESIILTVTYFEFLMRDIVDHKSIWFFMPLLSFTELPPRKKFEIRKKIKKYLDNRKLYDQYLVNIHLYQDSIDVEIEALYHTLFDSDKQTSRIRFQNLDQVKEILKFLYNVNIIHCLSDDKIESQKKWKLLERLIKERHNIVHNGYPASLSPKEIIEVLNCIAMFNSKLSGNLIQFGFYELRKKHEMRMEDVYKRHPELKKKKNFKKAEKS